MRWAEKQRQLFIAARLEEWAFINRNHLTTYFNISTPTASRDLQMFMKLNPNRMVYNRRKKEYELTSIVIATAPLSLAKELQKVLADASAHLDFCGYGDKWERECARESKLEERIEAVLTRANNELGEPE